MQGVSLATRGSAVHVHQFLVSFDGLVPAVLLLLPVAAVTAAVSVALRVRRFRAAASRTLADPLLDALLIYCSLLVGYLVFTPQTTSIDPIQLDPGNDLAMALDAQPGDSLPWIQLVGNVLLFAPLGAMLPMRLAWLDNVLKVALVALLASCVIELLQLLFVSGRVVSTDDVVLNTTGGTLGSLLTKGLWRHRMPMAPLLPRAQHSGSGEGRYPVWWLIAEVEAERRRHDELTGDRYFTLSHARELARSRQIRGSRPGGRELVRHS
jgi:VanZ family protein